MELTLRQIHEFIKRIIIRKHNEHAQVAALHGVKIDLKYLQEDIEDFSEEQKNKMNDVIQKAINRNVKERLGV